jgi:phosphatidylglycerophosphate synthase
MLTQMGVTPNAISAASMGMALGGALGFIAADRSWLPPWLGFATAAVFIQLRLVCNLMDGMVAIEGGRKSATGGIWNEVPDRFADSLLLIGAGLACTQPWAGAAAAWAAVMTAYVRELGARLDGIQDFCGPFAKPQRMAALTAAALLAVATNPWPVSESILPCTLWLIAMGSGLTALRRLWRMARRLKQASAI